MSEDILFGVGAVLIVLALFVGIPAFMYVECTNNINTRDIESANLGKDVEGSFSIFGGSIDSKRYYLFYVREDGGLLLKKTPAKHTVIKQTDAEEPRIEFRGSQPSRDCMGMNHKLVVPEDTVVMEYNIEPGES